MKRTTLCLTAAILVAAVVRPAPAGDFSGHLSAEARLFPHGPLHAGQERHDASVAFQPEYYHEWEGGAALTAVLFGRLDSADSERTHFDVRELNVLWVGEGWELRAGIGKVFWGVTEFEHLVDIINQTDLVESIDGEDKMGQPMLHLSLPRDWGVLDFFVLPGFRERTFPGRKGRLRTEPVVDSERAAYESEREEGHVDLAFRYSRTAGVFDLGLYHFAGTGREPTLLPGRDEEDEPVLTPFYERIDQTGLDAQAVVKSWLLKLEALYRSGQGDAFAAAAGGVEYSLVNVAATGMDLGFIAEYGWDERQEEATSPFQNDLMLGLRWALNDAQGTELLFGVAKDLEDSSGTLSLEGSRRLGESWVLSIEARGVFGTARETPVLHDVRDDDFLRTELAYYF